MKSGSELLCLQASELNDPSSPESLGFQNEVPNGFTRDRRQPRRLFIPGVQYMPHPSVVLKLDYRNIDNWEGSSNDEVSLGFGLVF